MHFLDTDDPDRTLAFLESLWVDQAALIPTSDHSFRIVAMHRDRLARRFTMTVPAWDVLETALDKTSSTGSRSRFRSARRPLRARDATTSTAS